MLTDVPEHVMDGFQAPITRKKKELSASVPKLDVFHLLK